MRAPLKRLLMVPHRLAFLSGVVPILPLMIWWGGTLSGWWQVSPGAVADHAHLMLLGFFPLFMMGFIFTAGPKWLNVPAPTPLHFVPVILGYLAGTILLALSAAGFKAGLLIAQLFHVVSWAGVCLIWFQCVRRSQVADAFHARLIALAFGLGLVAHLLKLAISLGMPEWHAYFVPLTMFGFLLPVFLAVSHRMIPFFSGAVLAPYTVWRPYTLLKGWLGGLALHGILLVTVPSWTWVIDLPLAASFLYCLYRWQSWRSFQVRLLAMLHLAFSWLPVAFLLLALESILKWQDQPVAMGSAGVHALTVGFFTAMLYAFVTRVSLGHSGRPLLADGLAWGGFLALLCVALLRVLAALFPEKPALLQVVWLGWCVVFAIWIARFAPIYWKARADGNPG